MTRSTRFAVLLTACCAGMLVLYSCSSIDRVSAPEFERALQRVNTPETVHAYSPIGVTANRAYIEHWSLVPILGERITVLWTPINELRPEALAKLGKRD